jgi:RimJ/RimL family protein N-acetyltransferase
MRLAPGRGIDIVGRMTTSVPLPAVVAADLGARLSGSRVIIEPLTAEHVDGLAAIATDSDMFAWMAVDLTDPATLRAWVQDALSAAQRGHEVPFAVRAADDGRVLGCTRFLSLALDHLSAEIGWTWYARSAWGTGINVETKLLLLGHAFETAGLRRVEFKTDARNERSRGALTALGAHFEGIFRKHKVLPDGGARDSAYYSVIDDEWPLVRGGLITRLRDSR